MKFPLFFSALFLTFFAGISSYAQEVREIDYESDRTIKNEAKYPGAVILSKVENQVHFTHEGIEIWCDQAIHYGEENFFKAYGNVRMQQGDTVTMTSNYAEYNGNTQFAFASGNVKMSRPQTSLETDTLFFNRIKQQAYYRSGGTIRDTASVLTSQIGRYFLETNKYTFRSNVVLTNPDYILKSTQLDFFSDTGNAFLYGPSTITSETSTIYCERGFYDTRGDTGYFIKNSRIDYENRILEGDSLYFDRNTNFASATNNIELTDTINNSIVRGHYAEVFREKDSVFITKRAVAVSLQDNDSVYIHADTLMITGKPDNRIMRGFYDVRMYKSNMSGKSDSLHVQEKTGLTQMLGNPVIWSGKNQITGDTIHLLNNVKTDELDSLKVYNNAFMIQEDSIEGFNQLKGKELYGLFEDNELYQVDILKNTETIYYMRNDENELIGINKTLSSSIKVLFENREVQEIYYLNQVDGKLHPEEDFPENLRQLKGFNWRGEEQLHSKAALFEGDPPLELVKIEGIPLPEVQDGFFEERNEDDPLLNEKSRLNPDDLKNKARDSIPSNFEEQVPEPLIQDQAQDSISQDSISTETLPLLPEPVEQEQERDTIALDTVASRIELLENE